MLVDPSDWFDMLVREGLLVREGCFPVFWHGTLDKETPFRDSFVSKYDELVENKALRVKNLDARVRHFTRKGTN